MFDARTMRGMGAILVFFSLMAALGAGAVYADPNLGKELVRVVKEQIIGNVLDKDPFVLASKIFLNNLEVCLFLFLGGASFGLFTVFIIGVNGLVIGGIVELAREQQGLLYVAAAIVPHGILEIPSFVIAGGLGVVLAEALWTEWRTGEPGAAEAATAAGRIFLRIVIPLVALAAIIEAFITPQILNLVV